MRKNLGLIALLGFAAAAILLVAAWLLSGKAGLLDFTLRMADLRLPVCPEDAAGRSASREIAWDGSPRMGTTLPGTVRYRPGGGTMMTVTGDAALITHVRLEQGDIKLDCRPARVNTGRFDITLPGAPLRTFSLSGVTSLVLEDLDQPVLNLNLAGSSAVSGTGKAERLVINAAGNSDARLGGLAAQEAELNLAGASTAEISASDTVVINSVGAATVTLVGEPKSLKTNIVGSGRILHRQP